MKWVHEGKTYDVYFKYIREKESVCDRKVREADEFVGAIKKMLEELQTKFSSGVIVKPSDTQLSKYFKRHKSSGRIVGILASFEKGNPDSVGWSLLDPRDTFDLNVGLEKAFDRAFKSDSIKSVPPSIRKEFDWFKNRKPKS
jgi:hypothetical protein